METTMNSKAFFVVVLVGVSATGCGGTSTNQPAVSPSAATSVGGSTREFGDFSFTIPDGWTVASPDRDKTKAMLIRGGTNWQNAKAMIKVDVGNPTSPTPEALAQGFAKSAGGTVSSESMDFDGSAATVASTTSTTMATPRKMIVIFRENRVYLFMISVVDGGDETAAINTIRESWKWTK
jgi:hypothetical protein